MELAKEQAWFRDSLLERFLRYVRIDTTSNRRGTGSPTTAGQLELARLLAGELEALGCAVELDAQGFLFALLPPTPAPGAQPLPEIGFMAHLDTSDSAPGKDIAPRLHENYRGQLLELEEGVVLDPQEFPELLRYRGDMVITSDGRTLLGADDKAGIAEILTALEYLKRHPRLPHGKISVILTPDEELGLSMERFPRHKVSARACYTMDGGEEGTIETECFEGTRADVLFHGRSIHTGIARGKLVNAIEMAARFLSLLPGAESPQATDGRYGFYSPQQIEGTIERASLELYLRDFEEAEVLRRVEALAQIGRAVEAVFPRGRVEMTVKKQYSNMRRFLKDTPQVVTCLEEAIRACGLEPVHRSIRGGTDGARLSELGIPTPNVFTGGQNIHSRQEWIALGAMVRASWTVLHLIRLWAETTALAKGRGKG